MSFACLKHGWTSKDTPCPAPSHGETERDTVKAIVAWLTVTAADVYAGGKYSEARVLFAARDAIARGDWRASTPATAKGGSDGTT